jgi:prepilin-type processing-associated H-X9-DG protein
VDIWLTYDFDPVHGPPGTPYSRVFLYADGHVQ